MKRCCRKAGRATSGSRSMRADSSALSDSARRSRAMNVTGSAFPACPICTAMLSSAAWPGLTEIRGTCRGQFLDMARLDVSLRRPHDRRRYRGRGGASLCRDAGSGIYPRRRIPLHPSRFVRRALRNIGELAERIAASAQATGIGLTLLPVFYAHAGFGGRAPEPEQRRFINDIDGFSRLMEASRRADRGTARAQWSGSRRIRCGR